jgi:ATP-dependent phosphofructokinase / diphosphate-dependent phosphofructokinase
LQPLAERLPTVLAPKTIDNDLGLNYPSEPDEWVRVNDADGQAAATATNAPNPHAVLT